MTEERLEALIFVQVHRENLQSEADIIEKFRDSGKRKLRFN